MSHTKHCRFERPASYHSCGMSGSGCALASLSSTLQSQSDAALYLDCRSVTAALLPDVSLVQTDCGSHALCILTVTKAITHKSSLYPAQIFPHGTLDAHSAGVLHRNARQALLCRRTVICHMARCHCGCKPSICRAREHIPYICGECIDCSTPTGLQCKGSSKLLRSE